MFVVGNFEQRMTYFTVAISDEDTALTLGTKLAFRWAGNFILTGIRASCKTAPIGSTLILDVNQNGASILGTKLSIDANEKTSTTATSAATITTANLIDDAEITIDVDQIGASTAGSGAKITFIGRYA